MPSIPVRLDSQVANHLSVYAERIGAVQSRLASMAVAKWLREQGVEVDYPRLRSNPVLGDQSDKRFAHTRATATPQPTTAA